MAHRHPSQDLDSDPEKSSPVLDAPLQHTFTHHDPTWDGTGVDFSNVDQQRILRKMDLHILPMLALLYLLAFLDRGNIGNANIEGLSKTLKLTGPEYNWCLTVFFFTYCVFEVPSNLM